MKLRLQWVLYLPSHNIFFSIFKAGFMASYYSEDDWLQLKQASIFQLRTVQWTL